MTTWNKWLGIAGMVALSTSITAQAADIPANSASQLLAAFAKVNPGDTISVAAGVNLGRMTIDGKKYPRLAPSGTTFVTIRSSASNPAYFQQVLFTNVRNLRVDAMKFDSVSGLREGLKFEITNNVEIVNCVIQGRSGEGNGLFIRDSNNVTISRNNFLDLHTSLFISTTNHTLVSENQLLRSSYDTIHIGLVSDLMIEKNVIKALPTSAVKHVDIIQFVNMGGGIASSNVTVRNNDFRTSNNVETHGIYFGNQDAQNDDGKNPSNHYKDLLIENNYLETNQMAAIAISYADNVVIKNNILKRPPGSPASSRIISKPTILVETTAKGVEITGNTTTTPPRAGHLETGWIQMPIPSSWIVNNNKVAN